jgi:hypothetical protein
LAESSGSGLIAAAALLGVAIFGGLAVGGRSMGEAVARLRAADRHVTVKGLSERDVQADLAIWPVVYNTTGDDLADVSVRLDAQADTIARFLTARGFAEDEISRAMPRVTDFEAQGAYAGNRPAERYMAEGTLTLRTGKVDAVRAAMQASADLVKQGVTLVRSYDYNPQFLYTRLDTIKPEMIAEATVDARRAAEQFAKDSGSVVGAIRSAQQGYFTIEDRDQYSPEYKKIRVVTTIDYFLD